MFVISIVICQRSVCGIQDKVITREIFTDQTRLPRSQIDWSAEESRCCDVVTAKEKCLKTANIKPFVLNWVFVLLNNNWVFFHIDYSQVLQLGVPNEYRCFPTFWRPFAILISNFSDICNASKTRVKIDQLLNKKNVTDCGLCIARVYTGWMSVNSRVGFSVPSLEGVNIRDNQWNIMNKIRQSA